MPNDVLIELLIELPIELPSCLPNRHKTEKGVP